MLDNKNIEIILKIAFANNKNAKDEVQFFKTIFEKSGVLSDSNKPLFLKMLNSFQSQAVDEILKEPHYTSFIQSFLTWQDLLKEDINEKLFHKIISFTQKPTQKEDLNVYFEMFLKKGKAIYLHAAIESGYEFSQKNWESKPSINKLILNNAAYKKTIHWALVKTLMDSKVNPFAKHMSSSIELFSNPNIVNTFFNHKTPIKESHIINQKEVNVDNKLFLDVLYLLSQENKKVNLNAQKLELIITNWLSMTEKAIPQVLPLIYELFDEDSKVLLGDFIEKKQKYKKYEKVFNFLTKYIEKTKLEKSFLLNEEPLAPRKSMKI